jgi:hypothetical protein
MRDANEKVLNEESKGGREDEKVIREGFVPKRWAKATEVTPSRIRGPGCPPRDGTYCRKLGNLKSILEVAASLLQSSHEAQFMEIRQGTGSKLAGFNTKSPKRCVGLEIL